MQDDATADGTDEAPATHREQLQEQRSHFENALANRDVIGQAKGLLMERYGLDDEAAFALLVRYSRTNNLPVRDLAADLMRTRRLPGDPEERRPTT